MNFLEGTMTTNTTLRRPGRPRKIEVAQETTPVVEQSAPVQEQPQQVQYTIAKLTPHMLAGEIHRLHQEGEDLAPVHQVSDTIRAQTLQPKMLKADPEPSPVNVDEQKVAALKAVVEAAKPDRPRTFAVAHYNKRGLIRLAHGVEYEDGEIDVHNGHGLHGAYADTLDELHETASKRHGNAYHVDYTDEP